MKFPYRGKPITPNELLELISPLTNVPTVVEALNLLLKEVRGKFGDQDVSFPRCVMAAAMVRHNIDASATSDSDLEQIKNAVSILHQRFGPICDEVVAAMLLHGVMVYPRRKAEGIDICKKALAALNKEGALTRCKLAKVLPFATVEFNASVLETRVPMASEIVTHTLSDLVNRPIGNQGARARHHHVLCCVVLGSACVRCAVLFCICLDLAVAVQRRDSSPLRWATSPLRCRSGACSACRSRRTST